ncbi:MAG: DUF1080 domain-containing protein [Pedosphaera sp.]|nr:DUF1080 domain-containing protein [Pedosphaera sp.]
MPTFLNFKVGALIAAATLAIAGGSFTVTAAKEAPTVSLFDGKTLAGWEGLSTLWSVKDGAITGITTKEAPIKDNTFLVWTNGTVKNFELRLQYRVLNGNSGIQYRSKLIDAEKFIVGGYQADLEAGKTYSGILYEERGRGILAERGQRTLIIDEDGRTKVTVIGKLADSKELQASIRDEQWNDYTIIADGNHLLHFINNRQTVDVIDLQPSKASKEGILALQIHAGPAMLIQFRDIRLKQLL